MLVKYEKQKTIILLSARINNYDMPELCLYKFWFREQQILYARSGHQWNTI